MVKEVELKIKLTEFEYERLKTVSAQNKIDNTPEKLSEILIKRWIYINHM